MKNIEQKNLDAYFKKNNLGDYQIVQDPNIINTNDICDHCEQNGCGYQDPQTECPQLRAQK